MRSVKASRCPFIGARHAANGHWPGLRILRAVYSNRDTSRETSKRRYYLLAQTAGKDLSSVMVNPTTGEYFGRGDGTRLFRAPCPEHGSNCNDPSQCMQQVCPHCDTGWGTGDEEMSDERDLKISRSGAVNGSQSV